MIPIEFEFEERYYSGYLTPVHGAGANVYHLMIGGFYYGGLRKANRGWVFDTNKKSLGMESLASQFGRAVERRFELAC